MRIELRALTKFVTSDSSAKCFIKIQKPNSILNFAGPDNDIYCNICCHKISWPSQYAGASDTAVIPGDDGEPNACPRCGGKVCVFFLLFLLFFQFFFNYFNFKKYF